MFWTYLSLTILWGINVPKNGRVEASTRITVIGYLVVLGNFMITGTLQFVGLGEASGNTVSEILEKSGSRAIALILCYFILELVPVRIIIFTGNVSTDQMSKILKNCKRKCQILLISEAIINLALFGLRTADYIETKKTSDGDQSYASRLIEFVLSVIKIVPDMIISYEFILLAVFFLRLKQEKWH
jgi:hypothetical protein